MGLGPARLGDPVDRIRIPRHSLFPHGLQPQQSQRQHAASQPASQPTPTAAASLSLLPLSLLALSCVLPACLRVRTHGVTGRPQPVRPSKAPSARPAGPRVGQRGLCGGGCSTPWPANPGPEPSSTVTAIATATAPAMAMAMVMARAPRPPCCRQLPPAAARCSSRLQPLVTFARIRPRPLTKPSWRAFPNRRPLPKRGCTMRMI
jgi:hypothetical protein